MINLLLNLTKGVIMETILKKLIGLFFTKEKMIGYGVGIAIAVAAASLDMQPKELRDMICQAYSQEPSK